MPDRFRFLINIDQCLNMSVFDIFFYKLKSQGMLMTQDVSLFAENEEASLQHAASEIREYLNKYSYYVDEYEILVAMRTRYQSRWGDWKDTLLYRLLQLHWVLQHASIFVTSREQNDRAINLLMLYDASFTSDLPTTLDDYLRGERMKSDCALLFKCFGLDWSAGVTGEQLDNALRSRSGEEESDSLSRELVGLFLHREKEGDDAYSKVADRDDLQAVSDDIRYSFVDFVREMLTNYSVFERFVDCNNQSASTLAALQVIEYLNTDVHPPVTPGNQQAILSLSQRCRNHWSDVLADHELEMRYSRMLLDYQNNLERARLDLESKSIKQSGAVPLPALSIPSPQAISTDSSLFGDRAEPNMDMPLSKLLEDFRKEHLKLGDDLSAWGLFYDSFKKHLDRMSEDLARYAGNLSQKYSAELEKRGRETHGWGTEHFALPDKDNTDQERLESEKKRCLNELKASHMSPSLEFQDQLNLEAELEKCNGTIEFICQCTKSLTISSFLLLFVIVSSLFLVHYFVLQPYIFFDIGLLTAGLIYIGALLLSFLACWQLPRIYFLRAAKKAVGDLETSMRTYIRGYFEKASNFYQYINLLNQLDYITRYSKLLDNVNVYGSRYDDGMRWHTVQVESHLTKLGRFQGLIQRSELNAPRGKSVTLAFADLVKDVVDCQLYWPQG